MTEMTDRVCPMCRTVLWGASAEHGSLCTACKQATDWLNHLAEVAFTCSTEHGFHSDPIDEHPPVKLALIHSEVSEALEDYRDGMMEWDIAESTGKPFGFPIELADILIRVFDLCGQLGINIGEMVRLKVVYNQTRPARHGDKKC